MEIVSIGIIALIIIVLIKLNLNAVHETMDKKGRKPYINVGEWTKIKTTYLKVSKVTKRESSYVFTIEMENKGRKPFEYNPVDFYFKGRYGIIKIDTYSETVASSVKGVKTLLKGDKLTTELEFKTLEKDRPERLIYTDFFIRREICIKGPGSGNNWKK